MTVELTSAQAQQINTSQPTPIKGLVIKGVKRLATVQCCKKGAGPDGEDLTMIVNASDYDEKVHGEIVEKKLPTRKKKAKEISTKTRSEAE